MIELVHEAKIIIRRIVKQWNTILQVNRKKNNDSVYIMNTKNRCLQCRTWNSVRKYSSEWVFVLILYSDCVGFQYVNSILSNRRCFSVYRTIMSSCSDMQVVIKSLPEFLFYIKSFWLHKTTLKLFRFRYSVAIRFYFLFVSCSVTISFNPCCRFPHFVYQTTDSFNSHALD